MKRGHAVVIGAGGSGHATGAIVEGGDAVGVGARAAGDAALGVVEANVLRVSGSGEREQQKRDGDADSSRATRAGPRHACGCRRVRPPQRVLLIHAQIQQ